METLWNSNLVSQYSLKLCLLRKSTLFLLRMLNGNKKAVFKDVLVITSDKIMETIHQSAILRKNIIIVVLTGYRICITMGDKLFHSQ